LNNASKTETDSAADPSPDPSGPEPVDSEETTTYGRTPDAEEVIDDSSPDVALDGSIAGQGSEPIDPVSVPEEQTEWSTGWLLLGILFAAVTVAVVFVLL